MDSIEHFVERFNELRRGCFARACVDGFDLGGIEGVCVERITAR